VALALAASPVKGATTAAVGATVTSAAESSESRRRCGGINDAAAPTGVLVMSAGGGGCRDAALDVSVTAKVTPSAAGPRIRAACTLLVRLARASARAVKMTGGCGMVVVLSMPVVEAAAVPPPCRP
jgi:hypothetical protein